MSVQVSYKKQTVLGIILLAVLVLVIEGFVNIWWYNLYTCEFEDNELFRDMSEGDRRQLCLENLEIQFTETELNPFQGEFVSINSHGFRGPEITLERPENTYRIFVIGGSTTFGSGVSDEKTVPWFLQEKINDDELDFNVQVINAGIPGMNSEGEIQMITTRLSKYQPDLVIVYDGANEGFRTDPIIWKERVIEECKYNKELGIDTIVILQPAVGTAERTLTDQELSLYNKYKFLENFLKVYPEFAKQLSILRDYCTESLDFRGVFNDFTEPVFFDNVHLNPAGNKIIAEKMHQYVIPLIHKKETVDSNGILFQTEIEEDNLSKNDENTMNDFFNSIEGIIFSYKTPKAISYFFTSVDNVPLSQILIQDEQQSGSDNLLLTNLQQNYHLKVDYSGQNLENKDFIDIDLRYANFENANLKGANFRNADLNGANLKGANLEDANFSEVEMMWADLSFSNLVNTKLENVRFTGGNLTFANMSGSMISNSDFSLTNFKKTDLSYSKILMSDFTMTNFERTVFSNVKVESSIFHASILTNLVINNSTITNSDFYEANKNGTLINNSNVE